MGPKILNLFGSIWFLSGRYVVNISNPGWFNLIVAENIKVKGKFTQKMKKSGEQFKRLSGWICAPTSDSLCAFSLTYHISKNVRGPQTKKNPSSTLKNQWRLRWSMTTDYTTWNFCKSWQKEDGKSPRCQKTSEQKSCSHNSDLRTGDRWWLQLWLSVK